jgi:SAM-dependent methyltransferase
MNAPPPEFDCQLYRASYQDLAGMTDAELNAHYQMHGRGEGRIATTAATRAGLLALVEESDDVLEIGPFTKPVLRGPRVKYFDVHDRPGLLDRARRTGYGGEDAPEIDYVSPTGDLAAVDRSFDVVVSSHCIEHQPDLVRHLNDVARLLRHGGHYLVIAPDKRYCFDHFIPESSIADVIQAHADARTAHTLASVIEHQALVTHNDCFRHWAGDHGTPRAATSVDYLRSAIRDFNDQKAAGGYLDVHAWQFTPASFRSVVGMLAELGLSPLRPRAVYGTPRNAQEFCAVLGR